MALGRITSIRALWLRATVLALLSVPALTDFPLAQLAYGHDPYFKVMLWAGYCVLLQLLIIHNATFREWLTIFSLASGIGMFTALSGATIEYLTRFGLSYEPSNAQQVLGLQYLRQALVILSVVPLALFAARCFPVSEICARRLGKRGSVPLRTRVTILLLRILSHQAEVVPRILTVWREEMPRLVVPRVTEGRVHTPIGHLKSGLRRLYQAIEAACLVLVIRSFEPLPMFVHEVMSFDDLALPSGSPSS